ncbi:unnamed protein product [Adineta ricciae]|uniref:Uncharacterized protein n=1 Tax=Adineta ricciae TaxID=249248 RepID=A0A815Q4L9_ADIRI|nr:unnamed protein product [Adineta ricciae]
MIAIAFATDYTGNTSSGITNYAAVAQQVNEYLGYSRNTLSVRLITFSGIGERKKRDTGSGISCNLNNGINYSTTNGSAMGMTIIVNNCPRTRCVTNQCIQNCLAEIKSNLLSVFGSTHLSLTFQTTDGQTIKTSCRLCQFGSISSGPTCTDGVKNGLETGADCGGPACVAEGKTCDNGLGCSSGTDCTSGLCNSGLCHAPTAAPTVTSTAAPTVTSTAAPTVAPTCTDGVKNGLETSVDCGGAACISQSKTCGTGLGCGSSTDCTSGVCTSGTCQAPTCTDGVKNGLETGADCGGVTCVSQSKTCGTGLGCGSSTDCTSGMCNSGTCIGQL